MLNFIQADLWRLSRMKSFYLMLVALLLFMSVMGFVMHRLASLDYDSYVAAQERETGVKISLPDKVDGEATYEQDQTALKQNMNGAFFLGFLTSDPGFLYLGYVVFLTMFIMMDYRQGYMKNILNIPHAKRKWFVSKLVTSLAVALVFLLASLALASVLGLWRTGELGFTITDMARFIGVQSLAMVSLGAVVTLCAVLFQQTIPTLLISIALALNIQSGILGLIGRLNLVDAKLSGQNLISRLFALSPGQSFEPNTILLLAGVYIVGLSLIGLILLERRDIA